MNANKQILGGTSTSGFIMLEAIVALLVLSLGSAFIWKGFFSLHQQVSHVKKAEINIREATEAAEALWSFAGLPATSWTELDANLSASWPQISCELATSKIVIHCRLDSFSPVKPREVTIYTGHL